MGLIHDSKTRWSTIQRALFRAVPATAAIIVLACQNDPMEVDGSIGGMQPPQFSSSSCVGSSSNPYGSNRFVKLFGCNEQMDVRQYSHTGDPAISLSGAAGVWNSALGHSLPNFTVLSAVTSIPVPPPGTTDKTIYVEFVGGAPPSSTYCGVTDATSFPIRLRLYNGSSNCNGNTVPYASLSNLLVHELGHAIGFQGGFYHTFGSVYVTGHCAMRLPNDLSKVNGDVCQTEVEDLYYIYGIRDTGPDLSTHVLTGIAVPTPSSVTVEVGHSVTAWVSGLQFDRGNLSISCDEGGNLPSPCTPATPSDITYSWGSSDNSKATASSTSDSVQITGVAVGTAVVSVSATGAGPYQFGTFFNSDGAPRTVAVTVVPAHGVPTQITKTAGDNQSAAKGTAVVVAPQVRVVDYYGAGVANDSVTFTVLTGGGSATGTTQLTDTAGYATVGTWTLGATAGTNTLRAQASGSGITGNPATFSATGTTIAPPSSFRRTDCTRDVGGGPDTMVSYRFDWTNGTNASGWQLVVKFTNDTTGSMPILQSGGTTASTWTPSHVSGTGGNQYFFLRNLFGAAPSKWVPLNSNPINPRTVDPTCRIVV